MDSKVDQKTEQETQPLDLEDNSEQKGDAFGGLDDEVEPLELDLKSGGQEPKKFPISKKSAELSKLVTSVLEGDADAVTIDVRQVQPETLAYVVAYLEHHKGKEPEPLPCPVRSIHMSQIVSDKWDATWIDAFDKKTIFEIILAANYMDIKSLLHLGCAKIATLIKQLDQKEINRIIEEEEKYRREHAQNDESKAEEKDAQ